MQNNHNIRFGNGGPMNYGGQFMPPNSMGGYPNQGGPPNNFNPGGPGGNFPNQMNANQATGMGNNFPNQMGNNMPNFRSNYVNQLNRNNGGGFPNMGNNNGPGFSNPQMMMNRSSQQFQQGMGPMPPRPGGMMQNIGGRPQRPQGMAANMEGMSPLNANMTQGGFPQRNNNMQPRGVAPMQQGGMPFGSNMMMQQNMNPSQRTDPGRPNVTTEGRLIGAATQKQPQGDGKDLMIARTDTGGGICLQCGAKFTLFGNCKKHYMDIHLPAAQNGQLAGGQPNQAPPNSPLMQQNHTQSSPSTNTIHQAGMQQSGVSQNQLQFGQGSSMNHQPNSQFNQSHQIAGQTQGDRNAQQSGFNPNNSPFHQPSSQQHPQFSQFNSSQNQKPLYPQQQAVDQPNISQGNISFSSQAQSNSNQKGYVSKDLTKQENSDKPLESESTSTKEETQALSPKAIVEKVFFMASDNSSSDEDIYEVNRQDVPQIAHIVKALDSKKVPVKDLELIIEALSQSADNSDSLSGISDGSHKTKTVSNVLFIAKDADTNEENIYEVKANDLNKVVPIMKVIRANRVPVKVFVSTITELMDVIKNASKNPVKEKPIMTDMDSVYKFIDQLKNNNSVQEEKDSTDAKEKNTSIFNPANDLTKFSSSQGPQGNSMPSMDGFPNNLGSQFGSSALNTEISKQQSDPQMSTSSVPNAPYNDDKLSKLKSDIHARIRGLEAYGNTGSEPVADANPETTTSSTLYNHPYQPNPVIEPKNDLVNSNKSFEMKNEFTPNASKYMDTFFGKVPEIKDSNNNSNALNITPNLGKTDALPFISSAANVKTLTIQPFMNMEKVHEVTNVNSALESKALVATSLGQPNKQEDTTLSRMFKVVENVLFIATEHGSMEEEMFQVNRQDVSRIADSIQKLDAKKVPLEELQQLMSDLTANTSFDFDTLQEQNNERDMELTQNHRNKSLKNAYFTLKDTSTGKKEFYEVSQQDISKITPLVRDVPALFLPVQFLVMIIWKLIGDYHTNQDAESQKQKEAAKNEFYKVKERNEMASFPQLNPTLENKTELESKDHSSDGNKRKIFTCSDCEYQTHKKKKMAAHMKNVHNINDPAHDEGVDDIMGGNTSLGDSSFTSSDETKSVTAYNVSSYPQVFPMNQTNSVSIVNNSVEPILSGNVSDQVNPAEKILAGAINNITAFHEKVAGKNEHPMENTIVKSDPSYCMPGVQPWQDNANNSIVVNSNTDIESQSSMQTVQPIKTVKGVLNVVSGFNWNDNDDTSRNTKNDGVVANDNTETINTNQTSFSQQETSNLVPNNGAISIEPIPDNALNEDNQMNIGISTIPTSYENAVINDHNKVNFVQEPGTENKNFLSGAQQPDIEPDRISKPNGNFSESINDGGSSVEQKELDNLNDTKENQSSNLDTSQTECQQSTKTSLDPQEVLNSNKVIEEKAEQDNSIQPGSSSTSAPDENASEAKNVEVTQTEAKDAPNPDNVVESQTHVEQNIVPHLAKKETENEKTENVNNTLVPMEPIDPEETGEILPTADGGGFCMICRRKYDTISNCKSHYFSVHHVDDNSLSNEDARSKNSEVNPNTQECADKGKETLSDNVIVEKTEKEETSVNLNNESTSTNVQSNESSAIINENAPNVTSNEAKTQLAPLHENDKPGNEEVLTNNATITSSANVESSIIGKNDAENSNASESNPDTIEKHDNSSSISDSSPDMVSETRFIEECKQGTKMEIEMLSAKIVEQKQLLDENVRKQEFLKAQEIKTRIDGMESEKLRMTDILEKENREAMVKLIEEKKKERDSTGSNEALHLTQNLPNISNNVNEDMDSSTEKELKKDAPNDICAQPFKALENNLDTFKSTDSKNAVQLNTDNAMTVVPLGSEKNDLNPARLSEVPNAEVINDVVQKDHSMQDLLDDMNKFDQDNASLVHMKQENDNQATTLKRKLDAVDELQNIQQDGTKQLKTNKEESSTDDDRFDDIFNPPPSDIEENKYEKLDGLATKKLDINQQSSDEWFFDKLATQSTKPMISEVQVNNNMPKIASATEQVKQYEVVRPGRKPHAPYPPSEINNNVQDNKPKDNMKIFYCPKCPFFVPKASVLVKHRNAVHGENLSLEDLLEQQSRKPPEDSKAQQGLKKVAEEAARNDYVRINEIPKPKTPEKPKISETPLSTMTVTNTPQNMSENSPTDLVNNANIVGQISAIQSTTNNNPIIQPGTLQNQPTSIVTSSQPNFIVSQQTTGNNSLQVISTNQDGTQVNAMGQKISIPSNPTTQQPVPQNDMGLRNMQNTQLSYQQNSGQSQTVQAGMIQQNPSKQMLVAGQQHGNNQNQSQLAGTATQQQFSVQNSTGRQQNMPQMVNRLPFASNQFQLQKPQINIQPNNMQMGQQNRPIFQSQMQFQQQRPQITQNAFQPTNIGQMAPNSMAQIRGQSMQQKLFQPTMANTQAPSQLNGKQQVQSQNMSQGLNSGLRQSFNNSMQQGIMAKPQQQQLSPMQQQFSQSNQMLQQNVQQARSRMQATVNQAQQSRNQMNMQNPSQQIQQNRAMNANQFQSQQPRQVGQNAPTGFQNTQMGQNIMSQFRGQMQQSQNINQGSIQNRQINQNVRQPFGNQMSQQLSGQQQQQQRLQMQMSQNSLQPSMPRQQNPMQNFQAQRQNITQNPMQQNFNQQQRNFIPQQQQGSLQGSLQRNPNQQGMNAQQNPFQNQQQNQNMRR